MFPIRSVSAGETVPYDFDFATGRVICRLEVAGGGLLIRGASPTVEECTIVENYADEWRGELLPLTHYVRIARGILLRGASLGDHLGEAAALALFLVVTFVAAIRLFRKEIG